jgi:hypothetical protein
MSERSFRRDRERRITAAKRREATKARKAATAAAVTGAFVLAAPAAASAATFTVNQTNDGPIGTTTCAPDANTDPCNLRDAIDGAATAAGADQIVFDSGITGDTITLNSGPLTVDDNDPLTIYGGPTPDSIYVDGNGDSMVFDIVNTNYNPGGLTLSGLTIQNGSDDPAGGIYAEQGTDVLVTNSRVTGNTSFGAHVDKYSFAGGGGITNFGQMLVQDSSVDTNTADVPNNNPYPVYGGGGIDNLGDLTVTGSTISGNGSAFDGGGIFNGFTNYPTSLKVSDTTLYDNFAYEGGGIASASFFGSGEFAPVGDIGGNPVSVTNSTISGNHSVIDGGGVGIKYLGGSARWKIDHSTISGNETYLANGGGVAVGYQCCGPFSYLPNSGSLQIVDSTVSGNYSNNYGGGVMVATNAQKYADTVKIDNTTIASNEARDAGGGIYQGYTQPGYSYFGTSLLSTIVGNNVANGGTPNDLDQGADFGNPGGTPFELSFSLVEAPGTALINQTPAGSNLIGVDPQLGALGNNGGPTETHLPSISSPVVDKGSAPGNLTTDQRGDPRTVDTGPANAHDGTDIGSVELPTGPPGPTPAGQTKVGTLKKKHKKRRRVIRTKHHVAKVRLTFRSNNPAVTFRCSVDGGPFEACSSPFVTPLTSAPGKGKNHNIAIQQVDSTGNPVGNVRVFRFRVVLKD